MKKKKKSFPKKPALVLTAAALLLVGSTVGSTRAALTYYSENYSAQMNMQIMYRTMNGREPQKVHFSQTFLERMRHLHPARNITKQSASRTAVRSTPLYV